MTSIPPRWRIAGLLFIGAVVNYLDRACISIVSPAIKAELGIDDAQMGLVFSSFFVGYASMNVVGGWAADRFGPRPVLAVSLVAWSGLCAATAAATGFASLLATRVLFGAAEGPFGAASAAAINGWFARREVARAIAAVASGTAAGAVVAGPLVGAAFATLGWRGSLIAVSCIGLLFAAVWVRFGAQAERDGSPSAATTSDEALATVPGGRMAVTRYLLHPPLVANALAYFAYTYLLAVYLSWLPLFFTTEFHLGTEGAAMRSSLPWVMAFFGIWAGAFLSDFVFRRTGRLAHSRRIVQTVTLAVAGIATAMLGLVQSPAVATTVVSVALFALFLSGTSFWAIVQDIVASRSVGTVSGATHFIANLGGIAGPAVTGALVQHSGSYRSSWLAAGLVAIGAVVCVVVAARLKTPTWRIEARAGA